MRAVRGGASRARIDFGERCVSKYHPPREPTPDTPAGCAISTDYRMQTSDVAKPETIDTVLRLLSWGLFAFTAIWAVTGTIAYFHRRAYNLTRAESSPSKNIKPDFLTVDRNKRQEAIERGEAYDQVLQSRAAPSTVETVSLWSRFAAMTTAVLALVTLMVATLNSIGQLQRGVEKLTNWETLSQLVSEHKAGTAVALIVIGANVIVFVEGSKKWRNGKAPAKR